MSKGAQMTGISEAKQGESRPDRKRTRSGGTSTGLGSTTTGTRRILRRVRRDKWLLVLVAPGISLLLVFHYVPIFGNVIAFKDYQPYIGILESPWVGLQNFAIFVNGDPAFLTAVTNTLIVLVLQVVLVFPIPIACAIVLNSVLSSRVKNLTQAILYLPHFMSWVIVVAIFQQMLGGNGLLNAFLRSQDFATVHLIGVPDLFKLLLTSQVIWKDTGWATIIFLAALSGISAQLYEAAAVDGAGAWGRTWHVTLPGLRGIIILLLILRLGDALTVGFEQIILQQQSVGTSASEVLDTYVYNNGIVGGNWGVSAAVGLVKGIVGTALVLGANRIAHLFGERGVYES
jgi:putative aldouronate transport system permease protein